jgi:hypothetical protein
MALLNGLDPTKIMRGMPLRVYIDPTFNSDGTVTLGTGGLLDSSAHANAVELGYTQDGAELTVSRTTEDLPVDQRNNNILMSLTGQEPHLRVGYLQVRDWAVLTKLQPGTSLQSGAGFVGISDQTDQTITARGVCAVAPTPNDATKYQVLIVYSCYNVADLVLKLSKEYNKTPLDFKGQDAGRADGKTWFAYHTVAV